MNDALEFLFEQQVEFRLKSGASIDGGVFVGETEFLPVETLRNDGAAYSSEFNKWLSDIWHPEQGELRTHLLKLHGNAKRYSDLLEAITSQQVIPLIGSGMSVPSGCPKWSDLLHKLREYTDINTATLDDLLNKGAFEEAADLLMTAMNSNLFNERIEHNLRIDDPEAVTGAVQLLPAIFPNHVITTNLDDLLEQLYIRCAVPFAKVLAGQELTRFRSRGTASGHMLLKLHGDCRHPDTRVLMTKEYDNAYAPGGDMREEIVLLCRSHSLLFLGSSLGPDRTVQLVADTSKDDVHMPKHYAFLSLPHNDTSHLQREHFLSERGIYPIWYDGEHDRCLTALLAGLLEAAEGI